MPQALDPGDGDLPSPLPWATRAGGAPYIPGHHSELVDNLTALLKDVDADPLVDRSFTWPGAASPVQMRQVLHFVGSCGLFTREGRPSRVLLTPEARQFLETGDTGHLVALLHAHVRFFGETLESIGEGLTYNELNRIAIADYGLNWKSLDQVRRRVHWMRGTGLVEYWTNGKIVLTDAGRALLPRLSLVRPSDLESQRRAAADLPAELPEAPRLLAERLASVTEEELRARKRVLGYLAGGASMAALSRLVDAAAAGLSRDEIVQFSMEAFEVGKSSAEQSLNTLQGLDLLAQVGPDRFAATDLAVEWLGSGEAVDLIRHLHLGLDLLGETLDALATESDSGRLTATLAEKYPSSDLTRKDVTARVALLVETGLAERLGTMTRRTALGTALAGSLPLQKGQEVRRDSVPSEGWAAAEGDRGRPLPAQLAAEVISASTDSADYQRFERALAEAFRHLSMDVEVHSGPAKTDLVVTLWLSPTSRRRIAVEAKTDGAGLVTDQDVRFMRLSEHRTRHQADRSVLIGPGFDSRVFREASKEGVAVLTARQLAETIVRHAGTPLYPHELAALLLPGHADALEQTWNQTERRTEALALVTSAMWNSANDPVDIEFGAGALDVRDIWRETKALVETPLDRKEIEEALAFLSSPSVAGVARRGTDHTITAPPALIASRLRSLAAAIEAKASGTESGDGDRTGPIAAPSGDPHVGPQRTDPPSHDIEPAQVRAWAKAEGRPVNTRGRLPESLIAQYRRAHGLPAD